jgi:hypothetical protein
MQPGGLRRCINSREDVGEIGSLRRMLVEQIPSTRADHRDLTRLAKALVEVCVRNTGIEDLHAGIFPATASGDFSDVKVVTPFGEIPWMNLSRISDEEMKRLMIEIADRVFTFVSFPEELAVLSAQTHKWKQPRLDPELMRTGRQRAARRAAHNVTS